MVPDVSVLNMPGAAAENSARHRGEFNQVQHGTSGADPDPLRAKYRSRKIILKFSERGLFSVKKV